MDCISKCGTSCGIGILYYIMASVACLEKEMKINWIFLKKGIDIWPGIWYSKLAVSERQKQDRNLPEKNEKKS